MKLDWKKDEKIFYLPKTQPVHLEIPVFGFFTLSGTGNPNGSDFADRVSVLYGLAYAVRMSPKSNAAPEGYTEYTVYPLEGVWGLTEEGIREYTGTIDKDLLSYTVMIRQPDFVSETYALETIERLKKKKPHPLLDEVRFEKFEEGKCVQMLHVGSYDSEPESFRQMEEYAEAMGLKRTEKLHREIYLSDPRKTEPAKMKTVLRFRVE
jgi:hypothetical protein